MNTLLNILFGFLIFIFISVTIVMMSGWVIMQVMYDNKKTASQEECGCKTCECDEPFIIEGYHNGMEVEDDIPMLDRPLTKKELEEVNMKPKINDFSKKTEITGMGGVGGPIDVIRGKNQTPTNEPREENDPNPTQK